MGKVPAIVHRGTVVTECGAICAYLADAFPAAHLAPPTDSPQRGTYYRWLFFGGTCVEAAVFDRMLSRPAPPRPGALGYGSYEDTLATLEKALTPGPYILGAQFSAADVFVGSQIGFGLMMKALEPQPRVSGIRQPPAGASRLPAIHGQRQHHRGADEAGELSAFWDAAAMKCACGT